MIYALISSLMFGIGDVFTKIASSRLKEVNMALYNAILSFPIALLILFIWHFNVPSLKSFIVMALVQIISCIAFLFFFAALADGPVSVVGSIVSGYSIIPFIGGMLFLGEILSFVDIVSVLAVIAGSVLISYDKEEGKKSYKRRWVIFTFIATILWGMWSLLIKYFNSYVDPYFMPVIFGIIVPFVWMPFFIKERKEIELSIDIVSLGSVILSVLLTTIGGVLFYIAVDKIPVSLATPIVGIYPVFTVLFSMILLKERLRNYQWISFLLIIAGIVGISI